MLNLDEVEKTEEVKTTSESEISSDEEVKDKKELIPKSFKVKKKSKINISKPLKIPPPVVQKTKKTLFEEVFEKPYPEKETKKLKLSNITLISDQINQPGKTSLESQTTVGFGFIHPAKKTIETEPIKDTRNEREEERLAKEEIICITDKELNENRITEKG